MGGIEWATALPVVFMALMGLSLLAYVVSDGYDLGVGLLMARASPEDRDVMLASIGPFWDANETWLVLGIGLLLVAFPKAHGLVLGELYLPVTLMLVGLILRGVAFDFRVKARDAHRAAWDRAFIGGSALAALAQGWMLGRYVSGFQHGGWNYPVFAAAIALALPAAYALIGAAWLVMKTEGELQRRAVAWARRAWWPVVVGMVLVSLATPWISETVRQRWFALPQILALSAIPLMTAAALVALRLLLRTPAVLGRACWVPFALLVGVLALAFLGLAYSLYPYVVIDRLTIWEAASSPEALVVIGIGCAISLPAIVGYTVFAYRVFRGKTGQLRYA